jgi:hypothetical protein
MAEPADRLAATPPEARSPQWQGTLDEITDSERRALRPIGVSAHEVAVRTGELLASLLTLPSVQIFRGVRTAADGVPPIPHAISAGRRVILVESVAWPPGRYQVGRDGRIHCDGVYIGQSVRPLIGTVCHWRQLLPRGHRVSALVVVHPTSQGKLLLPGAIERDLAWARPCDAVREIRACLPLDRVPVSTKAVAALSAATALW